MQRLTVRRLGGGVLVACTFMLLAYTWLAPCSSTSNAVMVPREPMQYVQDSQKKAYPYDRQMPLIFIGGVPRSGTTLMRAMLDAHPEVRCGEETRVIPRLLGMRTQWLKSDKESRRLHEAGLSDEVIDSALAAFILEVIAKHGEPAPRLCNKDPFTLKSTVYLSQMFPNSKFLLMIRDGRAVVHSIISRKVTISGFDLKNYRQCLQKWNSAIETMHIQCLRVGPSRCMPVYYEQLVLHPRESMEAILRFLDVPWHDSVLHHSEFINKPGGISLSKTERSTDQVIKPINMEALTKWAGSVPADVRRDIQSVAPMLERIGYDPFAYPPNYGKADQMVAQNTREVHKDEEFWRRKSLQLHQEKPVWPYGSYNTKEAAARASNSSINSAS